MKWTSTHANDAIVAFMLAFFMLIASAEALTYEECPDSVKIDSSWWNAEGCSGAIYAHGSLYLNWKKAPLENDTNQVNFVELEVSGSSDGTYIGILAWNGHSWSKLAREYLDFPGDYVYDLYSVPASYADGSMRIKIVNEGAGTVNVDGISVTIDHESKIKEYELTVRDCEDRTRLEGIEVEVDDHVTETDDDGVAVLRLAKEEVHEVRIGGDDYIDIYRNVYIYDDDEVEVDDHVTETDDDGVAVLRLAKEEVHEVRIGGDDYIDIYRNVYIYDDDEAEVCIHFDEDRSVDIDDLDVDDGVISFEVENTGNVDDDHITYEVFVNDGSVFSGSLELDAGDSDDITGSYDFPAGRHKVRARADASGYADSETVTYCVEGDTDNYMCSGGNVARETVGDNCVSTWETVEYCDEGCENGYCLVDGMVPESMESYTSSATCGASITSMAFTDGVPENRHVTVDVSVKNTGTGARDITVKAYIDGRYVDSDVVRVENGDSEKATLRFRSTKGTHNLRVDAYSCGFKRDSTEDDLRVSSAAMSAGVPKGREIEESDKASAAKNVYIDVGQNSIETARYESVVIKARVYPATETYKVSVNGVNEDWLRYSKVVDSEESNIFYVYVIPRKEGEYTLRIRVSTADGSATATKAVALTVTEGDSAAYVTGSQGEDNPGNSLAGMATLAALPEVGFAIMIALVAVVVILVFARQYMVENHDYDSSWNTPINYEDGVKEASIG